MYLFITSLQLTSHKHTQTFAMIKRINCAQVQFEVRPSLLLTAGFEELSQWVEDVTNHGNAPGFAEEFLASGDRQIPDVRVMLGKPKYPVQTQEKRNIVNNASYMYDSSNIYELHNTIIIIYLFHT